MNKPLLELTNVSAGYGQIRVLNDVTLSLQPGDVYALLGPNGGGKSTTLKVCSRQIQITSGRLNIG